MISHKRRLLARVAAVVLATISPRAWAGIATSGSILNDGINYRIGDVADGSLAIDGGSVLTTAPSGANTYLGYNSGCNGTTTVSGTGSKWAVPSTLGIGFSGAGMLTIKDGAQVNTNTAYDGRSSYLGYNLGSSGSASITGANSTWLVTNNHLYVGYAGHGDLAVSGGGMLSAATILGYAAGSSGTITVTGAGTIFKPRLSFTAGYSGTGTLVVTAGGEVNGDGELGSGAGSVGTATISGAGSIWYGTPYIGASGTATVTISDGGQLSSDSCYIGYSTGSNGSLILTGSGTKWVNTNHLHIGGDEQTLSGGGIGSLSISDGAHASTFDAFVGSGPRSSGTVAVSGSGATWSYTTLFLGFNSPAALSITAGAQVNGQSTTFSRGTAIIEGAGTKWLNGGGLDAEGGMVTIADGAQVSNSYCYLDSGAAAFILKGAGTGWTCGIVFVGHYRGGVLSIVEGAQVNSTTGYLGWDNSGTAGTVLIRGSGSAWVNTGSLNVGNSGTGTLTIAAGGTVNSGTSSLGYQGTAKGSATVSGIGSRWVTSGDLFVGSSGKGTLTVADGGQVSSKTLSVNANSTVRLRVSGDSMLVLGNATTAGKLTNSGTIAFSADAFLAAGTYKPIAAYAGQTITWSGGGSYNSLGGTWNAATRTFVPASAVALSSGTVAPVTTGSRILFEDADSNRWAGVSAGIVGSGVNVSASRIAEADLLTLPADPGAIVAAWTFSTNLPAGQPLLLSFDLGAECPDLDAWHLSGGTWQPYAVDDLICTGSGIASFTVTSFGGYALTNAVPEPTIFLPLLHIVVYVLCRRR